MKHVVSLSGGTASAVAAYRVIEKYGAENTVLWFADTKWEDEDLYRFLDDLEVFFQIPIQRYVDGRTPLEVAEQRQLIPNQRRAPCSLELKVYPFREFVESLEKPVTIHLGLDWTEAHRGERPKIEYEKIEGVTVDFPLMWKPYALPPHRKTTESWGIKTPRLYDMGFPHNNCGGRCVKQGVTEWLRLRNEFPERFKEVRDWEQEQRAKGGARASYAIARKTIDGEVNPFPLAEIEQQINANQLSLDLSWDGDSDSIACFCSYA